MKKDVGKMKLYHYTKKENVDRILAEGLIASSGYEAFTELRQNVVFCWLSPDSQKIFDDNSVCLEITKITRGFAVSGSIAFV